jgi:hypothetical protein
MRHRNDATSIVLVVYALTCLAFAVPLLFFLGWGSSLVHWYGLDPTAGKLMGAALAALAVASLLAATDPARHRLVVLTQLVFTGLGVLALGYRLLLGPGHTHDVGWVILGLLALFALLFAVFYPVDGVPEEA